MISNVFKALVSLPPSHFHCFFLVAERSEFGWRGIQDNIGRVFANTCPQDALPSSTWKILVTCSLGRRMERFQSTHFQKTAIDYPWSETTSLTSFEWLKSSLQSNRTGFCLVARTNCSPFIVQKLVGGSEDTLLKRLVHLCSEYYFLFLDDLWAWPMLSHNYQ